MKILQRIYLEKLLSERKGEGQNGSWTMQEYLVKSVTSNLSFTVTAGTKYISFMQQNVGKQIDVEISVQAKLFNDRYYNNINIVSVIENTENKEVPNEAEEKKTVEFEFPNNLAGEINDLPF